MVELRVVGMALRARFTILQKALLPASLIGGAIGCVLITAGLSFGFRSENHVVPAFHLFTLRSMSLRIPIGSALVIDGEIVSTNRIDPDSGSFRSVRVGSLALPVSPRGSSTACSPLFTSVSALWPSPVQSGEPG